MGKITLSLHGGKSCGWSCWHNSWLDGFEFPDDAYYLEETYTDRAVIAMDQRFHIVGVWKFDKHPRKKKLYSRGTWVPKRFRKHGIAKKMWEFGIKSEKPVSVSVNVVSDKGYTLVECVKQKFPNIKWEIQEDGERKLRKLK